ncbi:CCHC-type zinc finger protein CG3800-like [Aphidius gifuensis]|uniref:CCHC-type zinc finger protein CG3800-like n=1 Tax=Aphidius gifuensis TaxID=684658 RepID=UPI001CDB5D0D|nr:CCHC-type zinc finger protein CG3800-like [Aphidius gifuensis]
MKELAKDVLKSGIKPELGDYINWTENYDNVIQQAADRKEELTRRATFGREEPKKRTFEVNFCQLCQEKDHIAPECKLTKPPITTQEKPITTCYKCRQRGHVSTNCPQDLINLKKKENQQSCQLCNNNEHIAKNCPTIVKKLENDKTCQICDTKGHD